MYSETKKTKTLVGDLSFDSKTKKYIFNYERKYLLSKAAIPLGPELPLKKQQHQSKAGELFPSFQDRIPSKQNPAYEDYCRTQGISSKEKNSIILLSTIGRRGPSTFVFESVYLDADPVKSLLHFRKEMDLSLRELALVFDLNFLTLHNIEKGKSTDKNTLKIISIYLNFPQVILWQIQMNERRLHQDLLKKVTHYFKNKLPNGQLGF